MLLCIDVLTYDYVLTCLENSSESNPAFSLMQIRFFAKVVHVHLITIAVNNEDTHL